MNSFLEQKKVNLAFPREGQQLSPQENCSLEHGRFFFWSLCEAQSFCRAQKGLQSCSHVRTCQPRGPKTWNDFDGSLGGGPWSKNPLPVGLDESSGHFTDIGFDGRVVFCDSTLGLITVGGGGRYEKTDCPDANGAYMSLLGGGFEGIFWKFYPPDAWGDDLI